jgi:hypothetical protein
MVDVGSHSFSSKKLDPSASGQVANMPADGRDVPSVLILLVLAAG